MKSYVYLTTNLINGMMYVGKRTPRNGEFESHYIGSGKYLMRAVKKFGKDNFRVKVIGWYETENEAYFAEIEEIKSRDAVNSKLYYNLREGGLGNLKGSKLSEEHKRKIGDAQRGRKKSEESKLKMSETAKTLDRSHYNWRRGPMPESTRQAMSKAMKKTYRITSPNGDVYITSDISEFCRDFPYLNRKSLQQVASGSPRFKDGHHKGWSCSYHPSSQ